MVKLGIAAAALLAAGCAGKEAQAPAKVGMANPASVHCLEVGGTLAMENRPGGQVGICTLPDGSKIEEWALFRRDQARK